MSRKPTNRQPLIDWIAAHPLGVTAKEIKAYAGWVDGGYTFEVMKNLREKGLVEQYGRTALARWCSPQALPAVKEWHAAIRKQTIERHLRRKRKNKDYVPRVRDDDLVPRQVIVPASHAKPLRKYGPASVWELASCA